MLHLMMLAMAAALDVSRYVGVALVFALMGTAVLYACRVPMPRRTALLLGAAVTQAVWSIAAAMIVMSGLPLRYAGVPVWLVTLTCAAYGLYVFRRGTWTADQGPDGPQERETTDWILLGLSLVLPFAPMAGYLGSGLTNYHGSGVSDGWAYVAAGQYLWAWPRGTEGGLSPLYEYGSLLSYARNVASGELALLSLVVRPGQAYASAGLFQALTLFALCSGCAAFARARRTPASTAAVYLVLVGASGWVWNLIWANNYDHAIALAFAPALATIIVGVAQPTIGTAAVAGLILAGLTYTYPELAIVIAGSAGLVSLDRLWRTRQLRWGRAAVITSLVWLVLVLPSIGEIVGFFSRQLGTAMGATAAARPGDGMFPGLVNLRTWPASLWGISAERNLVVGLIGQQVAGVALTVLVLIGLWRLLRRREWGSVAAVMVFLAGALLFALHRSYDYGTYKVLLTGWWLIALALAAGWEAAANVRRGRAIVLVAATLAVCMLPASVAARDFLFVWKHVTPPPMGQYRGVADLGRVLAGQPVAIVTGERQATYWAVYFLRDANARIGTYHEYLGDPQIRRNIDHAKLPPWPTVRYVLTDADSRDPAIPMGDGWIAVWRSGVYTLWDTGASGWATITDISHGSWHAKAAPFIRLNHEPLSLTILANHAGQVSFLATYAATPGSPSRARLTIQTPLGTRKIDMTPGDQEVTMAAAEGESVWLLSVTPVDADPPNVPVETDIIRPRVRWHPAAGAASDAVPAIP